MKKKLIIGILGIFVILVIIAYFSSKLFGIDGFSYFGICIPGSKPHSYFPRGGCYMPSIYDGKDCIKKADCRVGYCTVKNREDTKGICQDNPIGCVSLVKEKDQFGDFGICFN